jgi:hypothetical protein
VCVREIGVFVYENVLTILPIINHKLPAICCTTLPIAHYTTPHTALHYPHHTTHCTALPSPHTALRHPLQVSGVENIEDRLKIVSAERSDRFPDHFSLAKLVCVCVRVRVSMVINLNSFHPIPPPITVCVWSLTSFHPIPSYRAGSILPQTP